MRQTRSIERLCWTIFGLDKKGKVLTANVDKDGKEEDGDDEPLGREEAKVFRGLVARMVFF